MMKTPKLSPQWQPSPTPRNCADFQHLKLNLFSSTFLALVCLKHTQVLQILGRECPPAAISLPFFHFDFQSFGILLPVPSDSSLHLTAKIRRQVEESEDQFLEEDCFRDLL